MRSGHCTHPVVGLHTMNHRLRVRCHDFSLVVILNICVGDFPPRDWVPVLREMPSVNRTTTGILTGISFSLWDRFVSDSFLIFRAETWIISASAQQLAPVGNTLECSFSAALFAACVSGVMIFFRAFTSGEKIARKSGIRSAADILSVPSFFLSLVK